jgi:hypothetical protein
MPTPVNRESLNKSLEERYKTQKVGGAFDAKKATPDIFGDLEKKWTKAGFVNAGDEKLGIEGTQSKKGSLYIQGFSNKKYKQ